MAGTSLPYVPSYGMITTVLEKIKAAETPPRFTHDYLATTLDMSGGSPKALVPFLKRTGFLGSDGVPTDLYRRFRNESSRGAAAAEALKIGYKPLYAANEYVHDAKDTALRGLIVQVTGTSEGSSTVKAIVGSFKALKAYSDFSAAASAGSGGTQDAPPGDISDGRDDEPKLTGGLNLGYTINLHLPATSDVAVFNAIFRSLREHLLR